MCVIAESLSELTLRTEYDGSESSLLSPIPQLLRTVDQEGPRRMMSLKGDLHGRMDNLNLRSDSMDQSKVSGTSLSRETSPGNQAPTRGETVVDPTYATCITHSTHTSKYCA